MKKQKKTFSLLELLVVIAIITILAALLLPAVSKAKNLGKQIQCLNNMHQIGLAVGFYTNDYGYSIGYNIPSASASMWYHLLSPYIYTNSSSIYVIASFNGGKKYKYTCPAVEMDMTADTSKWGSNRGTIGFNGRVQPFYSQLKGPNLKYPSRLILAGDSFGIGSANIITLSQGGSGGELRPWHNNGINVLYYDLRAGLRKPGTFSTTQLTPFWTPDPSYENRAD